MSKKNKLLVTGGAGFLGSEFVRQSIRKGYRVVVVDKLTYAGDLKRLERYRGKFVFYQADVCDEKRLKVIFKKEKPDIVIHFAAESHVDRSILASEHFIDANILGTQVLLEQVKNFKAKRFVHISTDEVYGDIVKGKSVESNLLNPSSPYAASKAAADLIVKSYFRTFGISSVIVRPSNNYGQWQYPEKFIPRAILSVLKNQRIPVYAKGRNIREWLYVGDCVQAILLIMEKGKIGETYNLGSGQERKNIDVAKLILDVFGAKKDVIEFVKDRPGHDFRYRLNCDKLMRELKWKPTMKFEDGLKLTVQWCVANKDWLLSKYKVVRDLYK